MGVHHDETDLVPLFFEPASFMETAKDVTSQPLVCQELERVHEILAHTLRRGVGPKHLRLAALRAVLPRLCSGSHRRPGRSRAPPVALLPPAL